MPILALNTVLPQTMRVKYQVAIGVLPLGLMFAAFLPLIYFASWLEAALGIAPNSPIKNHENGTIWITVFLVVMVIFMLLGYILGWLLNAALVRTVFAWPAEKIAAVYLRSEVPSHWLKTGEGHESNAAARSIAKWEEQRKLGAFKFILTRGILAWGGPMLLAMYVVPTAVNGQSFDSGSLVFNFTLWAVAGAAFGALIWFTSESNYRKLTSRK